MGLAELFRALLNAKAASNGLRLLGRTQSPVLKSHEAAATRVQISSANYGQRQLWSACPLLFRLGGHRENEARDVWEAGVVVRVQDAMSAPSALHGPLGMVADQLDEIKPYKHWAQALGHRKFPVKGAGPPPLPPSIPLPANPDPPSSKADSTRFRPWLCHLLCDSG